MRSPLTAALLALLILEALLPPPGAADGARTPDTNNTFETATALQSSGSLTESVDFADDKSDFFKLTAPSGEIIKASLFIIDYVASEPGRVDFNLFLYNKNREAAASSASSFQWEAFASLAVSSGSYYIEVRTVSGGGGYTLDYSVEAAQVIRDGNEIHGYLSDSSNHNSDWYRVQLGGGTAPDIFSASMHEQEATTNFDLFFMDLWSEYSFWYDLSWWSDPDEHVEAAATYSGWYYLQVNAYKGKGNYILGVSITPGTGDGDSAPAAATEVPYNSTFISSVDMAVDKYDFYRCSLAEGETITAVMWLDPMPKDMFSLSILTADLASVDFRTNYIDDFPPSLDRTVSLQKPASAAGTYYIVVMAKVGLIDGSPDDVSDKNAWSDYTLNLNFTAHPPPPANHPPRAKVPGAAVEFDANSNWELDLSPLFSDPDGDPLHYLATGNRRMSVGFGTPGRANLTPERYWYGSENFTLTAYDPQNANASIWVNATVRLIPFPPELSSRTPDESNITGANGTELKFTVRAKDPKDRPLSYLWTVNEAPLPNATAELAWRVPAESGLFRIRSTVSNIDGTLNVGWNVTAAARPPINVTINSPRVNNLVVKEGDTVTFHAILPEIPDPVQARIAFTWYLNGRWMSDRALFYCTTLPVGQNTIEVRATNLSDPRQSGQASIVLFVEEKEAQTDQRMLYVAAGMMVAIIGIALALFLVLRERRRARIEEEEEDSTSIRRKGDDRTIIRKAGRADRDRDPRRSKKKWKKRAGKR